MELIREELVSVPRTFKDTNNVEWDLRLTLGAVDDVKRALGVDLLRLDATSAENDEMTMNEALFADLVLLCKVFYVMVKKQHPEVDEDTFLHAMGGEAGFAANRAFQAELLNFFRAMKRPELEEMILTSAAMIEAGAILAIEKVQALDLDKLLDNLVKQQIKDVLPLSDLQESQE